LRGGRVAHQHHLVSAAQQLPERVLGPRGRRAQQGERDDQDGEPASSAIDEQDQHGGPFVAEGSTPSGYLGFRELTTRHAVAATSESTMTSADVGSSDSTRIRAVRAPLNRTGAAVAPSRRTPRRRPSRTLSSTTPARASGRRTLTWTSSSVNPSTWRQ